jgi:hypothetical protein
MMLNVFDNIVRRETTMMVWPQKRMDTISTLGWASELGWEVEEPHADPQHNGSAR